MTPRVAKPEKRASKLEKKVQLKKEKRQIYWENVLTKGTNGVLESKIHVNSLPNFANFALIRLETPFFL